LNQSKIGQRSIGHLFNSKQKMQHLHITQQ